MTNKRPLSATEPEAAVDARRRRLDALQNNPPQTNTANAPRSRNLPRMQAPASATPLYPVTLGEAINLLSHDQMVEHLSLYALQHAPFRDLLQRNHAAELNRRRQIDTPSDLRSDVGEGIQRQINAPPASRSDGVGQGVQRQINMPPASRCEGVTQGVRQQINKPTVYRFDGIVLDLFKQLYDTFQEENETPPIMAAHNISISIKSSIKSMREKALAEGAPLQTRENAIVAMTLIGEIVATCEDIVGLELRDKFKGDVKENAFTQAFVDLARSFSDAERPQILNNVIVEDMESSSTTFEARLDGLIGDCIPHRIFPDLDIGLEILRGEWSPESEVDSGSDVDSDGSS
ncbi:hypothetical protein HDK64DRAFT_308831 [Phyllosticta capitalensis]